MKDERNATISLKNREGELRYGCIAIIAKHSNGFNEWACQECDAVFRSTNTASRHQKQSHYNSVIKYPNASTCLPKNHRSAVHMNPRLKPDQLKSSKEFQKNRDNIIAEMPCIGSQMSFARFSIDKLENFLNTNQDTDDNESNKLDDWTCEANKRWFYGANIYSSFLASASKLLSEDDLLILKNGFSDDEEPHSRQLKTFAENGIRIHPLVERWNSTRLSRNRNFNVTCSNLPYNQTVIQGSVKGPIPLLLNQSPRLFWADKKNGRLEVDSRNFDPKDKHNTGKRYQIYWVPWKNVEGEIVGLAVSFTGRLDVRVAALANWQCILTLGDKACSYRYWYHEFGWNPDWQAARSFGVYATDILTAMILKWWYRLRLISIGTLMKQESIYQLHALAGYLDETVWHYYDQYSDFTKEWLDLSEGNMREHVLNQENKFPGIDRSLISRINFKKEHGFDPLAEEV